MELNKKILTLLTITVEHFQNFILQIKIIILLNHILGIKFIKMFLF